MNDIGAGFGALRTAWGYKRRDELVIVSVDDLEVHVPGIPHLKK